MSCCIASRSTEILPIDPIDHGIKVLAHQSTVRWSSLCSPARRTCDHRDDDADVTCSSISYTSSCTSIRSTCKFFSVQQQHTRRTGENDLFLEVNPIIRQTVCVLFIVHFVVSASCNSRFLTFLSIVQVADALHFFFTFKYRG